MDTKVDVLKAMERAESCLHDGVYQAEIRRALEAARVVVAELIEAATESLPSNPANDLQPNLRLRAALAQASQGERK